MLNTPILFIIFNRPETTRQVFENIRQAQPKQLFVAADGPRVDKIGEKKRCDEARKIATTVDWDCDVQTLFSDENKGCGRGPAEAITWFFEHVEQGIILEDDCLPSQSFFFFCQELLYKYKNEENIFLISGINHLQSFDSAGSYVFSRYAGIWGWATWKRAWIQYDYSMKSWGNPANRNIVNQHFKKNDTAEYFYNLFERSFKGIDVSWWDYQWLYCRVINNSFGIVPSKNLIKNIGFGAEATHTFDTESFLSKLDATDMDWPLIHPDLNINEAFDLAYYKLFDKQSNSLQQKIKNKLFNLIAIGEKYIISVKNI